MKPILPTEYDEQCLLVEYLELKGYRFSKVAQETYTSNWGIVMKNKKSGLRKGVPDLIVILPKKLLFIEMKRKKSGKVSPEQKAWIDDLNKIKNVEAIVCWGFEDAVQQLTDIAKK